MTANLTLKATPAWLTGYEGRLATDAQGAGGKLTKTQVTTEDLSRQIVDTQAAVNAKTALRDRLLQMLQTRSADLSDLLAVQEKLSDAQGDLDATNSELATMKERIATSDVTIDYTSTGVLAPQGTWSPVGSAVTGASGVLAASIAVLIYAVAFLAPWVLIIGGLIWAFRKRIFRPGKPKPVPAPKCYLRQRRSGPQSQPMKTVSSRKACARATIRDLFRPRPDGDPGSSGLTLRPG